MTIQSRYPRAFTLIEVVIAISILGVILSVAYSALSHIMTGKRMLDDGRDASLVTNAVLLRLTRELQLIYSEGRDAKDFILMAPPGTKNYPHVALLGESGSLSNGQPGSSISFLALEGGQYMPDGMHSGIVQITYRVAENPDGRNRDDRTYLLIRDETPYVDQAAPDPDRIAAAFKETMTFPITSDLLALAFEYYDAEGEQWVDTWGEEHNGKFPLIIRFSLSLRSPLGRVSTYSTAIPIKQPVM